MVRRVLAEEWQIEQQLANASSDQAREEIAKLTEELNQRAKMNQEYWADRKYRELLKATVFPAADFDGKTAAPAKTRLEALRKIKDATTIRAALGNTKLRKNVRQLVPGINPSSFAGLWLIDMYVGLEEFFTRYNARKHSTTLQAPDAMTEASLVTQGRRLHRVRQLVDILPIISPMARGCTRVLDPARGLFVNYRYYSNPALAHYSLRDTDLLVRPVGEVLPGLDCVLKHLEVDFDLLFGDVGSDEVHSTSHQRSQ